MNDDDVTRPRYVRYPEASSYLAIPQGSLRNMVSRGQIPHIRLGGTVLFDLQDLDAWLENFKQPVTL